MTREEILAMEPGRELSNLVAVKVMGWTFAELDNGYGYPAPYWTTDGTEKVKPSNFWNPSTDISAAWEVAERYPIATIERVEIFVGNVEVKASLWEGFDYKEPVEATAKTAPEAICKAALLTVMDKEAEA